MGRPKTEGVRVNTALRLPVDLHARLAGAARDRDVSVNWLIVRAVRHYLFHLDGQELP